MYYLLRTLAQKYISERYSFILINNFGFRSIAIQPRNGNKT